VDNQSKPEQGTRGTKTNDCEASLRADDLPKAEKVIDAVAVVDGHKKAIAPQLGHDGGDDTRRLNSNSPDAAGSI
jgi:hypothetical protein